jgi:ribosomal-protein-serine acetyltransferase
MLRHELPSGAYLRLLEESDAEELFALTDRNRAHLEPWLPWVPGTQSPDDSLAFIRTTRRQVADNDGLSLAVVRNGAIAGTAGFHPSTGRTARPPSATGCPPTSRGTGR